MKTSSGGSKGAEARKNNFAFATQERKNLIRTAFDLAYATRVFTYREVRTLTPLEVRTISERFSEIIEERNRELEKT